MVTTTSEFVLPALIPTCSIRKKVGKIFLELNSKTLYQIQEEKKKVIVLCSRPRHNVKLGTFML